MVKALVLWAHEDSPNLGVAALARGSRRVLEAAWPEADITCVNFGSRPSQFAIGSPRSMLRERVTGRAGMSRWLGTFDVAWDTRSGDSFTDIYGSGRHRLMTTTYAMATAAGAKGVLAPQTIGPFHSGASQRWARSSLRRSRLVYARDPASATAAAELGHPVRATVADVAFAIEQPVIEQRRDVILNVSGLLWVENPHVDAEKYRAITRRLIDALRTEGRMVSLMAHVGDSVVPDNDALVVRELAAEYRLDAVAPDGLDAARSAIAGSRIVIGARMHACLNAISTGVPALPQAYSRKFLPLFRSLSWAHGVDLREDADPVDTLVADVLRSDELAADAAAVAEGARASLAPVVGDLKALG